MYRRILPAAALIIVAAVFYMALSSVYFLSGISPERVVSIVVQDSSGDDFTVDNPSSIARIVNTVQATRTHRRGIALSAEQYRYRLTFYGENETVLESYDLNAINAICKPPFYYETPFEGYISIERDDPLCFNYLATLADGGDKLTLRGVVVAMEGSGIVVEPEEGSTERAITDRVGVAGKYLPSVPEPAVGDTVEVIYNGGMNTEADPARLGEIFNVSVVSRGGQ